MSKNYSFEKGKYGLTTGTIIPFGVTLNGDDPAGPDWVSLIPAGFLRCDGQILRARDYLGLSQILGVGEGSKFRKENQELEEASDDLRTGQFQLPDLGSKYMNASSANGRYDNITVVDPITSRVYQRVGVEVELSLNEGNSVEISYGGQFTVPNIPIPFPESSNFVSTLAASSDDGTIGDTQMLAHGHYSNAAITWRSRGISSEDDAQFGVNTRPEIATGGPKVNDQNPNPGSGYTLDPNEITTAPAGSSSATTHTHSISKSPISKSISSNVSSFQLPPSNIITTVNFSKSNIFKLDDIQHRFILVEFLIKT
jgi:hypothetical protein